MEIIKISPKKQAIIDAFVNSPLQVGETVDVRYNSLVAKFLRNEGSDKTIICEVVSLDPLTVVNNQYRNPSEHVISMSDIVSRKLQYLGANPFTVDSSDIRSVAYDLDSVLFNTKILGEKADVTGKYDINSVPIMEINWNPFVYIDGEKKYYQRPFVWSIEDNQTLIESIYQRIDCGKLLIRKRGWNELRLMQANGETELSFRDIVDGKQRLNAVRSFIKGEYPDMHGNYYADLSAYSQNQLTNHQLFSYSELPEDSHDETIINQFLRINFTGVPQSKEHIEFVKSLKSKICL